MLDIKFVRENPEIVKKDLEKRKESEKIKWVDNVLELDKKWKGIKREVDALRKRRNEISQEINKRKKEKKDVKDLLEEVKEVPKDIKIKEDKCEKLEKEIKEILMRLPNILHESVPYGEDEEDNEVVREVKAKPKNFEVKSHVDLIRELDLADLERAAKISGARHYFLKGDLALLDMAIHRYAVDFMTDKGFNLVLPPYMIRRKAVEGVTDLAEFGDTIYKIEDEDSYLIATSEHPLTSMYMDEVLDEKELPLKLVGYSSCFRKEAGSHGKDTKGIFRVHQFNKTEQIVICKPEESWKIHEELIKNAEEFVKSLGIPYRVVNICTGDIGIVAAKKYDIEAWMPAQKKFREIVSCSNCTGYQAVRLNLKYRDSKEGKNKYVHTLNSTCVATPRMLVAILENFQNEDGSVDIPEVLWKYMNGKKKIVKD